MEDTEFIDDIIMIDELLEKPQDKIISFLKNNNSFNINSTDTNGNYFIQQIIIKNYPSLFYYILKNFSNINLDILDKDNRSICYYIIRLNRTKFIDILLEFIDNFIGFPIMELKDNDGYYSLSYAIIFNNYNIFTKLYKSNKIDVFKKSKKGDSLLHLAIKNKNEKITSFLIDKNFPINSVNDNLESISHYFITFFPTHKNILSILQKMDLTIKEKNFGLSTLHLIAMKQPNLLLNFKHINKDLNIVDYYGNSIIFYLIIEKHYKVLEEILPKYHDFIDYTILNINSDTILHLYLESKNIKNNILKLIIQKSNLNVQNNQGNTPTHLFMINKLDITLLKDKIFNIFILNNNGESILDLVSNKKDFIQNISIYFSNFLNKNKNLAKVEWEKKCIKKNNCQKYILKYLTEEKKNPPFTDIDNRKIILDHNLPVKQCQYAGINLDILFGLIFIKNNTKANIILEFPLTVNKELVDTFKNIGIDLQHNIDFINIQIYWAYQQLILPSFLSTEKDFKNLTKSSGFTIIPIGIEIDNGGHANILILDHNKKTIERFEPQGANPPMDFNYNPNKLDFLLEQKFNITGYKYIRPDKYLPPIGLQFLESLETQSCNIGDPNGFCAVWCIWWAFHKITNNIDSKILIDKLIHKIKLGNYSFKEIIRNFSTKITSLRDKHLKDINLDINLWIQGKYDKKHIDKLTNNISL